MMPSIDDVFNELHTVNQNLQSIGGQLSQTNVMLESELKLTDYLAQAAWHITTQLDSALCELEHIAHNTCELVNEGHVQITLQRSIDQAARDLSQIEQLVHAHEFLLVEKQAELRREIEVCCPPEPDEPPCTHEPCEAPARLDRPPEVQLRVG